MSVVAELFIAVAAMILFFILVFVFMYLLAISLFPIEKELSKLIWTEPKPLPPQKPATGGFKDFSSRHKS